MPSRKRPSPALVISLLALFVSLSGIGVAATGGNFILGQLNTSDDQTQLTGPSTAIRSSASRTPPRPAGPVGSSEG